MDKSRMKRVQAFFFATESGHEPVREWLMELDREDRREVGQGLMTLEFGWPVGMPLARAMGRGLHELRIAMEGRRHARVFFYIDRRQQIVLLHAFIKQTQTTPRQELDLARQRMHQHQRSEQ